MLATASFFLFKSFLPAKLFPTTKVATKNVVIDSLLLDAINEEKLTKVDTFDIKISSDTLAKPIKTDSLPVAKVFVDNENYTGAAYLVTFLKVYFS